MTHDDGSEFTFACRCHRPAEDRLEDLLSETTPNCWTKYPAELPRKWEVEMYSDGASIVLPTPRGVTINGRPSTHIASHLTLGDAAAIVALHNAAPALLDVVRAARTAVAECVRPDTRTQAALSDLDAALTRLDGES